MDPLQNPVILKRIEELLAFEDRKTFRLVCKNWYDASLPRWRNNSILKVKGTIFLNHKPCDMKAASLPDFLHFLNDTSFTNWDRHPIKSIKFTQCQFLLDDTWDKISGFWEHVHFDKCYFGESSEPADNIISRIVFEKLSNLKTLKMTTNDPFPRRMMKLYGMSGMAEVRAKAKLQQNGFQPHKRLKEVSIAHGIPEMFVMILPLAENLQYAMMHTLHNRKFEINGSSGDISVGDQMIEKMFQDKETIHRQDFIEREIRAQQIGMIEIDDPGMYLELELSGFAVMDRLAEEPV